ncbi:MAG: MarR family winged helix-turn-helix transcriptional regulator [Rhodobacteraceae bacterium]|nr:MarR family winged helix-turn-helix transcriptional regulator [Paracoccaceae bacterium]
MKPKLELSVQDTPLHQFLTYRLSRVQAKLNAQANALLQRSAGLTLSKWRILALIGAAGQTRLSELARMAALDKGLLSRNLKIMVDEGLVKSKQDDIDHRVQHLSLTNVGQTLFEETLPKMRARQSKLRGSLNGQELETLFSALDKLEIASEWRGDSE